MRNNSQQHNALSKSIGALSWVFAFVPALLIIPGLSASTLPWFLQTLERHYGPSLHLFLGDLLIWTWVLIVGVTVFLTIRIVLLILLLMINNWLLLRI